MMVEYAEAMFCAGFLFGCIIAMIIMHILLLREEHNEGTNKE